MLAPARLDASKALDLVSLRSQPLQGPGPVVPSPGEQSIMGEQMDQDQLQDETIVDRTDMDGFLFCGSFLLLGVLGVHTAAQGEVANVPRRHFG